LPALLERQRGVVVRIGDRVQEAVQVRSAVAVVGRPKASQHAGDAVAVDRFDSGATAWLLGSTAMTVRSERLLVGDVVVSGESVASVVSVFARRASSSMAAAECPSLSWAGPAMRPEMTRRRRRRARVGSTSAPSALVDDLVVQGHVLGAVLGVAVTNRGGQPPS